jgi:hypothetical protein
VLAWMPASLSIRETETDGEVQWKHVDIKLREGKKGGTVDYKKVLKALMTLLFYIHKHTCPRALTRIHTVSLSLSLSLSLSSSWYSYPFTAIVARLFSYLFPSASAHPVFAAPAIQHVEELERRTTRLNVHTLIKDLGIHTNAFRVLVDVFL